MGVVVRDKRLVPCFVKIFMKELVSPTMYIELCPHILENVCVCVCVCTCVCVCMCVCMYVPSDTPSTGAIRGTGMRGVNTEGQNTTLGHDFLIPSETQVSGVLSSLPLPLLNTGPGASCISCLSHGFPAVLGQGRSKFHSQICSKPWVDQRGVGRQTGLIPLGSSSHEDPLGADLGDQLLHLIPAEAQVLEEEH